MRAATPSNEVLNSNWVSHVACAIFATGPTYMIVSQLGRCKCRPLPSSFINRAFLLSLSHTKVRGNRGLSIGHCAHPSSATAMQLFPSHFSSGPRPTPALMRPQLSTLEPPRLKQPFSVDRGLLPAHSGGSGSRICLSKPRCPATVREGDKICHIRPPLMAIGDTSAGLPQNAKLGHGRW